MLNPIQTPTDWSSVIQIIVSPRGTKDHWVDPNQTLKYYFEFFATQEKNVHNSSYHEEKGLTPLSSVSE